MPGDQLVLRPPRWVKWRATLMLVALVSAFLITFVRPSPARLLALCIVFVLALPVMLAHRAEVTIDRTGIRRGRRFVPWDDVTSIDTGNAVVTTRRRSLRLPGPIAEDDLDHLVPTHIEVT